MLTEDPATPGPGKWEVNIALTYDGADEGDWYESPLVDINYGIGERLQLNYAIPQPKKRNQPRMNTDKHGFEKD
jgi:hypothetical protein